MLTLPHGIDIYAENVSGINFKQIRDFINAAFGIKEVRLIRTRKRIVHTKGLLFDFITTQKSFDGKVADEISHIVLTNRLFATLGEDRRPHIRPSIYGFPSVISLSGIVEGPAKPKEFYIYKQRYAVLGAWELKEGLIKKKFKGQFIDYNDKRLTEALKGYIAQALFFYITGEPFCSKRSCRLYNAHWQKDLIYSQISSGKFCKRHRSLLEKIRAQGQKKPK